MKMSIHVLGISFIKKRMFKKITQQQAREGALCLVSQGYSRDSSFMLPEGTMKTSKEQINLQSYSILLPMNHMDDQDRTITLRIQ